MPHEGIESISHDEILRFEEIVRLSSILAGLGIDKIRLTGGEPLVRKGAVDLVGRLKKIPGIRTVNMTTNGSFLTGCAFDLKKAGIDGINISLDTIDREVYKKITGFDGLSHVMAGIDEALNNDISIKINCLPIKGINEDGLCDTAKLAKDRKLDVRFIELMPIGMGKGLEGIREDELLEKLEARFGKSRRADLSKDSGPAIYRSFEGFEGRIGFISSVSHRFCGDCNRLRLTAEGFLKLCLHYPDGADLKAPLRGGASDEEIASIIKEAIKKKPAGHRFDENKDSFESRKMYQIGG